MNIDKQLEVLRKALESGAKVSVEFFNYRNEQQAEEIAQEFATLTNEETKKWSGTTTNGIWVGDASNNLQITVYFDKEEVENVG